MESNLHSAGLTKAEVGQYWEQGYLFPKRVLCEQEARDFRAELENIESDWLDVGLPLALNQYKRVNAQVVMPLAARLACDYRVLDIVQSILGPDLLVWSAEFFVKEPGTKLMVGMHQDLTYWGLGETSDQVTAWIALSPATVASGCMDFVKNSHKNPILPHNDSFSEANLLSRGQEVAVEVADKDKTPIVLRPGEMSLHHGLTIHGSGPNQSDDRRIGFAIRYLSPSAEQKVADRDFAMLVRGADRTGNFINYCPPQSLFSVASLQLYEEIRQAQSKALAAGGKK